MKSILIKPEIHTAQILEMLGQWGLPFQLMDTFPDTGLIIEGKCVAYVYLTNSSVCFMDGLICNRSLSKQDREECLDQIVKDLIQFANLKGYRFMKGDTRHNAVVERGERLGFVTSQYKYHSLIRSL